MVLLNLDAVKEPKGFMKVLQFLFAILAFATTTSFSTSFSFHVNVTGCNDTISVTQTKSVMVKQDVSYPFRLDSVFQTVQLCDNPASTTEFHYQTNTSSDAEFFVAIGVVCMFYAAAALAVYSFWGEKYSESRTLPTVDFILHGVLALLWLAAASAWADGTGTLKDGCNPNVWLSQVCADVPNSSCVFQPDDSSGHFGGLHISLLFGFLNMFLWASNMWFLYKETPFFKGDQLPPQDAGNIGNI